MITLLKSKILKLKVTHSSIKYEGSITLPISLIKEAGLIPYEQVHINNMTNGNRDITYVLGTDKPIIAINGALSKRHSKGDIIHVLAYHLVNNDLSKPVIQKPIII
jgi:aspartate 1-decarboxylase